MAQNFSQSYPNTPTGAGMKAKAAIANATKRSRKTGNPISNFMNKESGNLQKVGKGIRNVATNAVKNAQAAQSDPRSSRADFSINPLKGAGTAFRSAFK